MPLRLFLSNLISQHFLHGYTNKILSITESHFSIYMHISRMVLRKTMTVGIIHIPTTVPNVILRKVGNVLSVLTVLKMNGKQSK